MIYNLWKAGTDHQELKVLNPTKFYKFLLIIKEGTVQWKPNDLPYLKTTDH